MIESLPLLAWPMRRNPLTILVFHRVLPVADALRPGEPDVDAFMNLMTLVARRFAVLPLREAVERMLRGRLLRRACCITFDDGYADNLTTAVPVLEHYGLPATIFVATGYLDGGRMFNDAVIDAIARSTKSVLDLETMALGRYPLDSIQGRRAAIAAVRDAVKYRPPEARVLDVAKLLELADCGPLPRDIMLTSDQVRELSRRGFEIGGHTAMHPILTSISDDRALDEILAGKNRLEEIVGKPVTSFAYPNGRPSKDYGARHVSMVKRAGFELAVTTAHGVAERGCDVYQLPRFRPWGHSLTMLGARMLRNAWSSKPAIA